MKPMSIPSTASSTPTLQKDEKLGLKFSSCIDQLCKAPVVEDHQGVRWLELLNFHFSVEVPGAVFFTQTSRPEDDIDYVGAQLAWYAKADQRLHGIDKYRPDMWKRITDNVAAKHRDGSIPEDTRVDINSNYGQYVFEEGQLELAIKRLAKDPMSRQAVVLFNRPRVNLSDTKDHICTTSLQFLVRDGALHAIATMRSNELWNGFRYDVAFFTFLMDYVRAELWGKGRSGIKMGYYHHNVGSFHVRDDTLIVGEPAGMALTFPPLEPGEASMLLHDLLTIEGNLTAPISPAMRSLFCTTSRGNSKYVHYQCVMNLLFNAIDKRK